MNVRAVVFGGGGFVGRSIVGSLREAGDRVEVVGRRRGDHLLDLGTATVDQIRTVVSGADLLVHAAGAVSGDARHLDRVNVQGTVDVVEASVGEVGRLIYISSTGRYGMSADGVVDERSPARPTTAYERTKALAEDHVTRIGELGVLSTAALQPSVVLGGEGRESLVCRLMSAARRGLPLPGFATGSVLSAVSLDSVAHATAALGHSDVFGPFILSQPIPWADVYSLIDEHAGRTVRRLPSWLNGALGALGDRSSAIPFSSEAARALTGRATFSSERAQRELGYRPATISDILGPELA